MRSAMAVADGELAGDEAMSLMVFVMSFGMLVGLKDVDLEKVPELKARDEWHAKEFDGLATQWIAALSANCTPTRARIVESS